MGFIVLQCTSLRLRISFIELTHALPPSNIVAQGALGKAGSNPELKMLMTCKSQGLESPFGGRDSTRAGACVRACMHAGQQHQHVMGMLWDA